MKTKGFSRFTSIALLSALALLPLSACGNSGQTSEQSNDAQVDPDTPPATNAGPGGSGGHPHGIENNRAQCMLDTDCATDEACTQGGRCINITGERDAAAVLQADLDDLPDPVGVGVPYRLPPNATLRLLDDDGDGVAVRVNKTIILDGQGTQFRVQPNVIGIQIAPTAPRTSIRDIRFDPDGRSSSSHEGIGIDVRARGVRLDNILAWRMGTGVRAHTYVGDDFADVSRQQWTRMVFRNNYHYALDFRGAEASGGLIAGVEPLGGAGIYDGSFLGNTYLAPALEGTHSQSLYMDSDSSAHLVLGIYLEGGDPLTEGHSTDDLHLGGNGISRLLGPADRVGNHSSMIHFAHPESGMRTRIPGSADSAIAFRHPQEGEWWHLKYWNSSRNPMWGFSYRNQDVAPLQWTGSGHPDGPAHLEID